MTPAVTVILPVRNGARFVGEAVASILTQELSDFELLAVDDGSEDGTLEILDRLQSGDNRMRVVSMKQLGIVAALNRGIAEARAPLLARMDADDVAHSPRLARQVKALDAAPGVAMVGSAWREIDVIGRPGRVVSPPRDAAAVRAALLRRNPFAHPSVMMRTDAVRAVGGYRAGFELAEDFDLWLRLAELHDLVNLDDVLLDYRVHAGQSTQARVVQRACSEMAALAAAARRAAGLAENVDARKRIDREALRALGLEAADISQGIVGRAMGSAIDALAAKQPQAARSFAAAALAEPGLQIRTRLHLCLLLLRARLG